MSNEEWFTFLLSQPELVNEGYPRFDQPFSAVELAYGEWWEDRGYSSPLVLDFAIGGTNGPNA